MKDSIHQLDIQEVDLSLGRMDVNVYVSRVNLDIQEIAWKAVLGNHFQIGVLNGMVQIGMLDKPFVHKKILLATGLFCKFCLDNIAINTNPVRLLSDRQQFFFIVTSEQSHDALLEVARIQMIHFFAVTV